MSTAVIGIGNELMGDDGIGPRLVYELQLRRVEGVDPIDLSTGGMSLVHELAKHAKVIIIDAADMGLPPGEFRAFPPEEAVSVKFMRGYSLHDWDVLRSIGMSRELGEAPASITIFAVQPGSVREGEGISPELEGRIDTYIGALLRLV